MEWYLEVFRKYGDFDGRARRREYWMFYLMNCVVCAALYALMFAGGRALAPVALGVFGLYWLATIIPSFAVAARRLHDTGRSGWWQLIILLPLIGVFVLLYFLVQDGDATSNEFGPNPKAGGRFTRSTPAVGFGQ